jgi:hypothetical protein
MRTSVGVAFMAILVSIVAVGTLAVSDNIEARRRGSESVAAGSSSEFNISTGYYCLLYRSVG